MTDTPDTTDAAQKPAETHGMTPRFDLSFSPAQIIPSVSVPTMPASIVKAISDVKTVVRSIAKDGENTHGSYNSYKYASVDQVYALLVQKMAAVGLVIAPIEVRPVEIKLLPGPKGTTKWAHFTFGFVYATKEDTWFSPLNTEPLMIQITGPQTFGAAKSFAAKVHYRALFQIPTGDLDLDQLPQEPTEEEAIEQGKPKRGKKVKLFDEDKSADVAKQLFEELVDDKQVRKDLTAEQLSDFTAKHGSDIDKLREHDKNAIRLAYAAKPGERVVYTRQNKEAQA